MSLRQTFPDLAGEMDLWRVQLPGGERTMTLESLDAMFDADVIDADTLVCPPGAFGFTRLGAIAGLDEDEAAPPSAGVDVDFSLSGSRGAPLPLELPSALRWRPPSAAPLMAGPVGPPRFAALSLDLGDASSFKPRWSIKKLLLVPAGLAAIGIIAIAASASASSASTEAAAALAANARTELVAPAPVVAPTPAPSTPAPVATAPTTAPPSPLLSDAQKKALSAKDKKAEAAKSAKRAAAAPKHSAPSSKGSSPFTKTGNKHDPLNGGL